MVPTEDQRVITAQVMGEEFALDGANDDYSYAGPPEDVAMLLEEILMRYHFGIERDIAFTIQPAGSYPGCGDYLVKWGVRGRIGDPNVRDRAKRVVREFLPATDWDGFFTSLPDPRPMRVDVDWCSNLSLDTYFSGSRGLKIQDFDGRIFLDRLPPSER